MSTIRCDLSKDSVDEAIFQLKRYENDLKTSLIRAMQTLEEKAVDICQAAFGSAVKVTSEPTENGFVIRADGKAVGFLEFGAGTAADTGHPLADNAPFPVYPGSYSEINAEQFSTLGYWIFGGRKYTLVYPRRGLAQASRYIQENAEEVIRSSINGTH